MYIHVGYMYIVTCVCVVACVHSGLYRTLCCLHARVHMQYEGRRYMYMYIACPTVHIPGIIKSLCLHVQSLTTCVTNELEIHPKCMCTYMYN